MEPFWEAITGADLRQGDYLLNCPIPLLLEQSGDAQVQTLPLGEGDLIIVTQSCDLENRKVRLVAACPIYPIVQYETINPALAQKGRWEEVRKGRVEMLHLLASPTQPDNNRAALVVDFREIYSLPFELLTRQAEAAEKRWRLKSPYLEHFSQAFARFFMRVGLPSSIPPFK
ncbi:MAG: hypothetical protein HOP19_23020 [Acidobacteria bacterium]|nr:hypothetical protein [Acidobacteriota bacterium]